tara:strand:+ start:544 stop:1383 length:840 start_codon:yes stop_codon:yes gene_type:complete
MKKKKLLIVGASGFIGNNIYKSLTTNTNLEVIGTYFNTHKKNLIQLDYFNDNFYEYVNKFSPDYVIWAAGEKNLKITEANFNYANKLIASPICELIKNLKLNPFLIYLSTDYVFSGDDGGYSVDDITNPLSNYGILKLKAEKLIKQNFKEFSIIRAGSVVGKGSTFYNWLIDSINESKSFNLFNNYFSPTPIQNVINLIQDIINEKEIKKLNHVSGYQRISRFELGLMLSKLMNRKCLIQEADYRSSDIKMFRDLSLKYSYTSNKNIDLITSLKKIIND